MQHSRTRSIDIDAERQRRPGRPQRNGPARDLLRKGVSLLACAALAATYIAAPAAQAQSKPAPSRTISTKTLDEAIAKQKVLIDQVDHGIREAANRAKWDMGGLLPVVDAVADAKALTEEAIETMSAREQMNTGSTLRERQRAYFEWISAQAKIAAFFMGMGVDKMADGLSSVANVTEYGILSNGRSS